MFACLSLSRQKMISIACTLWLYCALYQQMPGMAIITALS